MAEDKKYKIIIVDDDNFLVNMYSVKFGKAGVGVEVYKTGKAFLDALMGGSTASLILLDIVMPNMSGLEILKEMRRQNLAPGVPVIMLTNQNEEGDIDEGKKLGVEGYIVKSAATPSEVVEEVMKIINP